MAVHIGSQITSLAPFENAAFRRLRELVLKLRADGHDHRSRASISAAASACPTIIPPTSCRPIPAAYGEMVRRTVGDLGCALAFEPGRVIVGNAGILVARVIAVKERRRRAKKLRHHRCQRHELDLVRSRRCTARAMRSSRWWKRRRARAPRRPTWWVRCARSSDRFAQDYRLPPLAAGDLVAFMTAGAYGASMSSTYNARPLIPKCWCKAISIAVVRRRPSFDEMTALESLPPWLADEAPAPRARALADTTRNDSRATRIC